MELSYSETNALLHMRASKYTKKNSQGQKNCDQFVSKCAANTQNTPIIVCFALFLHLLMLWVCPAGKVRWQENLKDSSSGNHKGCNFVLIRVDCVLFISIRGSKWMKWMNKMLITADHTVCENDCGSKANLRRGSKVNSTKVRGAKRKKKMICQQQNLAPVFTARL